MKEVIKYQPEGFDYYTCDTAEAAKNQERKSVLIKYLSQTCERDAYSSDWCWESKKVIDGMNRGYRNGYSSGSFDVLDKFIKFYSDIKPKLDAIDNDNNQKIEEVKNA